MGDTEALLRIEGLAIEARTRFGEAKTLVDGVDLAVAPGSVHALVGESGSGKTMVARAVVDLLPSGIERRAGSIVYAGRELSALPDAEMRALRGADIGFVFQEPMLSLNPAIRIGRQMVEALSIHRREAPRALRERCLSMLEKVQIRDPERAFRAYPHEFSGGMRQRIMLASVLSLEPGLLIADEPTTALDSITQRAVLDMMVELTRELGTSVLLITHDLGLVAEYARTATVMQFGEVVESGTIETLFGSPRTDYTRELLSASPGRQPRDPVADETDVLLEVEELSVEFPGNRTLPWRPREIVRAVKSVTLSIRHGENVAVVGESGSGKSTVGRAVLGLEAPSGGTVRIDGERIDPGDRRQWRRLRSSMQMVFQDPASSLDPRYRVTRLVAEGLPRASGAEAKRQRKEDVTRALEDVGLSAEFAERFPHELSGGQKQRVAIARAIIMRPALVIADEPVSALDLTVQAKVLALMADIQRRYGFSYFFISHDLGVVEQVADRIVVMRAGRVVEHATRDELFDNPLHPYTRQLLDASVEVAEDGSGGFELARRAERAIPDQREDLRFHEPGEPYRLESVGGSGHQVALHADDAASPRRPTPSTRTRAQEESTA